VVPPVAVTTVLVVGLDLLKCRPLNAVTKYCKGVDYCTLSKWVHCAGVGACPRAAQAWGAAASLLATKPAPLHLLPQEWDVRPQPSTWPVPRLLCIRCCWR
jgi:hypothetical protein